MTNIEAIMEKYGLALDCDEVEMCGESLEGMSSHSFTGRRY